MRWLKRLLLTPRESLTPAQAVLCHHSRFLADEGTAGKGRPDARVRSLLEKHGWQLDEGLFEGQNFTVRELEELPETVHAELVRKVKQADLTMQEAHAAVQSLRRWHGIDWTALTESLCPVHALYMADAVYPHMTAASRAAYRLRTAHIARAAHVTDQAAARAVMALAVEHEKHIGWYVLGAGTVDVLRQLHARRKRLKSTRFVPQMQADQLAENVLVVCPVTLLSRDQALSEAKRLCVMQSANPDPHLHYLLLGRYADGLNATGEPDAAIAQAAGEAIRALCEAIAPVFRYVQVERNGAEPAALYSSYRFLIRLAPGVLLPPGSAMGMASAMLHPLNQQRKLGFRPQVAAAAHMRKTLMSRFLRPVLRDVGIVQAGMRGWMALPQVTVYAPPPQTLDEALPGWMARLLGWLAPMLERPLHPLFHPTDYMREELSRMAKRALAYFDVAVRRALPAEYVDLNGREKGMARSASPDGIGLYLCALLSAARLKLLSPADMIRRMSACVDALAHLPHAASAHQCGVLMASLMTCAQGVRALAPEQSALASRLDELAAGMPVGRLKVTDSRLLCYTAIITGRAPVDCWDALEESALHPLDALFLPDVQPVSPKKPGTMDAFLLLCRKPKAGFAAVQKLDRLGYQGQLGFSDGRHRHWAADEAVILCAVCNALCGGWLTDQFAHLPKAEAYRTLLEKSPKRRVDLPPCPTEPLQSPPLQTDAHLLCGGGATWLVDERGGGVRVLLRDHDRRQSWSPVQGKPAFEAAQAVFAQEKGGLACELRLFLSPLDGCAVQLMTLTNELRHEKPIEVRCRAEHARFVTECAASPVPDGVRLSLKGGQTMRVAIVLDAQEETLAMQDVLFLRDLAVRCHPLTPEMERYAPFTRRMASTQLALVECDADTDPHVVRDLVGMRQYFAERGLSYRLVLALRIRTRNSPVRDALTDLQSQHPDGVDVLLRPDAEELTQLRNTADVILRADQPLEQQQSSLLSRKTGG